TGKLVSVSGLSLLSSTNGSAPVYGYQFASASASANIGTITAASLAVNGVSANNKVYDATTVATLNSGSASVSPLGSDVVNLSSATATGAFADKNVGVAKPVTAAGFTLSGIDAGNYTLSQPAGLSADITV